MFLTLVKNLCNYICPQNVCEALRPLVTVNCYMGLVPVQLVGDRPDRHYRIARIGYLSTVIHLLLYILAFSRSVSSPSMFSYFFISDEITNVAALIQLMSAFAAMGVVHLTCFFKRYAFVAIMDLLNQIDRSLKDAGVQHKCVAIFREVCWGFLGTVCILIVYIASSAVLIAGSNHDVGISTFVTYFMPHTVTAQIVFQHRMMVRQIIRQMAGVNEILAKLHKNTNLDHRRKHHRAPKRLKSVEIGCTAPDKFKEPKDEDRIPVESTTNSNIGDNKNNLSGSDTSQGSPDGPESSSAGRSEEETIQKACDIHEELCDACYITEDYFSVVMLTIITIGFLIIVFNAYYVLEVIFRHNGKIDMETQSFIIFLVYQMFIHGLGLLVIVQNSSSVLEANERCSIHVHKLMCRVKSEAARQKLLEFSLQLLNRNVRFTAYNLFPLDRTLIFTIIGAATTYLIILVQFSIQFR